MQALIDGNDASFLELVRPDESGDPGLQIQDWMRDVRGCDLDSANMLVGDRGRTGEKTATFVFDQPCGQDYYGETNGVCNLFLVQLSGRWYVDSPWWQCDPP